MLSHKNIHCIHNLNFGEKKTQIIKTVELFCVYVRVVPLAIQHYVKAFRDFPVLKYTDT